MMTDMEWDKLPSLYLMWVLHRFHFVTPHCRFYIGVMQFYRRSVKGGTIMSEMFASFFSSGLWAIIKAALLLILAFIVAKIVKSLTIKLFTKTKLNAVLGKSDEDGHNKEKIIEFIGKLVHLLVFLLFVPGIFESLGMDEVSAPILNVMNTMWGYLPNILAAVIVLWAGFFIAKLVRELLIPVFQKIKVNRLQEKAGMEVTDSGKLSNTLAYIVYVLILIPVIITALKALNIQSISEPAIKMLDIIFGFIPNILAALIIIIVGLMIARFAGNIVQSLIASSGLDAKLSKLLDGKESHFVLSKVVGAIVHVVLAIFFIVESLSVLHLKVVTDIGNAIIGYMPYVLAAVLILAACYVLNSMVQKALQKNNHATAARFSKYAIYMIGAFMILNELGIAEELVNAAFILIVAAFAVAFAVSFGIGGKEFAGRTLKKFEDKCGKDQKTEE